MRVRYLVPVLLATLAPHASRGRPRLPRRKVLRHCVRSTRRTHQPGEQSVRPAAAPEFSGNGQGPERRGVRRAGPSDGGVDRALDTPTRWCEMLMLHLNNRKCRADDAKQTVVLGVVRKYDVPVEEAADLTFNVRGSAPSPDYFDTTLTSGKGPYGTSNYRISLQGIPLDKGSPSSTSAMPTTRAARAPWRPRPTSPLSAAARSDSRWSGRTAPGSPSTSTACWG
jgi:hypothetical protein